MKATVFIPTRARPHLIDRVLPHWMKQPNVSRIYIVCERREVASLISFCRKYPNVRLWKLQNKNMGIAYARAAIVEAALEMGLGKIIMCDDDLYPRGDVSRLFEWDGLNTIGIGAMLPFYGLTFGNSTIAARDDPLFLASALGKRLFSLNISLIDKAGIRFDKKLHTFGSDNEIVRDAMVAIGATWYVHAGVPATSIERRHMPGGLNDLHNENQRARMDAQFECHELMYEKWGSRYINYPNPHGYNGRFICKWRNMLDDFIADWKELVNWERS